ncbi:unnamed protein product [Meganyctiphanes norvegica]|uniref:C2H2-type domain-containing protein n=1 Tax=Meganyctiphanes norvegica TaxID=48144 RepID=A0AAV2S6Q6_MEGNR
MNEKKCEQPSNCEFCHASFTDNDSLEQHLKLHSRRKPYKCDECEAKFSYKSTLEWHKKSHMGELPFQCNECGAQFHQNSILVWHKRKHRTGQTTHANTSRPIVVNVANVCPSQLNSSPISNVFCVPNVGNAVTSSVNSTIHSTCDSTSSTSFSETTAFPGSSTQISESVVDNLGKRMHDEEEVRFQCDVCGQVFQQSEDLRTHVQIKHNMGKNNPYYILAKQQEVAGHFIARKKMITEKKFKCDLCMAGFNTEGHLRTHRQKHITGRPFKCSKCILSFSDSLTLDSHERRHQSDRPHKCNHCGATFYRETHLQRHIQRHTGELV